MMELPLLVALSPHPGPLPGGARGLDLRVESDVGSLTELSTGRSGMRGAMLGDDGGGDIAPLTRRVASTSPLRGEVRRGLAEGGISDGRVKGAVSAGPVRRVVSDGPTALKTTSRERRGIAR